MLLNAERRQALNVLPALARVDRDPVPGHAAGVSRRIEVGSQHQLPVFLVRGSKQVPETVGNEAGFVAESSGRCDFDGRPKRGGLRQAQLGSHQHED